MNTKVLHLVEYLYQGGIERFLAEIGRIIPEAQLKQKFFAYEMDEFSGAANELKKLGKDVQIYKKEHGYDAKLLSKLHRLIANERITILHTHDFGPMEYAVALKILNPRLVLIHTQHTLHHFVTNRKYVLFFQLASYFYQHIISVSEHVKDVLVKKCWGMKGIPVVIHNGVDAKRYCELKEIAFTDIEGPKLRLVCISRISREKNLEHILLACKKLKESNVDFHLHHAGTGTQKEVESVLNFINDNQLDQHITLHGYQEDVREVLRLGDIFVSSSLTEGHPIAVLEAMASQKLCLCSDIPAHQKISNEGIILFSLEEKNALFNRLLEIKDRKMDYKSKIAIASNDIKEKYTLQQMITRYLDLYNFSTRQSSFAV